MALADPAPRSRPGKLRLCALCSLALAAAMCHAGGPRFVTGDNLSGAIAGAPMAFYTSSPLYFTDPGALNANVSNAQANAMVAAAAAVWNVPNASLTLARGGALAEHVSTANATFNGDGVTFPADVQASNFLAIPIAIVYDTDGGITDLLLGEGASDPASCRQNGVTESVDGFGQTGTIQHAVILLNGRCVGSTVQQLTQMQYQLMRAFGRVLGLAWSQLNDNVFTGTPTPTANNESYWPVMHPIDVLCSAYTYQCMQNPFQLRLDDIAALELLYPVTSANLVSGKTISLQGAEFIYGSVTFPTGQGMDMVNVTLKRSLAGANYQDASQIASGVTGVFFAQNFGNPISGPETAEQDTGLNYPLLQGWYMIGTVPLTTSTDSGGDLFLTTEAINPLYAGTYSLGTFERPAVTPSGSQQTGDGWSETAGYQVRIDIPIPDAASTCNPGSDGLESAPAASDPTGWWTGLICSTQHTSWWSAAVKAGHTWTLEVAALDDNGLVTTQKLQPLIGVWNAADPAGTLPTVAATSAAMNSLAAGTTQLPISASAADATLRIAVADQFGGGRPDFSYRARMLYLDSVAPTTVGSGGGLITLTGTGFQPGNEVLVNGVASTVISWSSTQIVAVAPAAAKAKAALGVAQGIEVLDTRTGGSTAVAAVLSYSAAVDLVQLLSAPASLQTGLTASPPFAVQVLTSDGAAPAIGASVRFTVSSGSATLGCGSTSCVVVTGVSGQASTTITGTAAGVITLLATELSGGNFVQVNLTDTDPLRAISIATPSAYLAAGASASWNVALLATANGLPIAGVPVSWSSNPSLTLAAAQTTTASAGSATATVTATGIAGSSSNVITACVWSTVCANWTAYGIAASQWFIAVASGANQSVPSTSSLAPVTLLVTDAAGHPLPGATVTVYQAVRGWEGPCPPRGRCPAAPILAASQTSALSDSNGLVVVTPQSLAGTAQVVAIAAATGTQGFTALTLTVAP